MKLPPIRLWIGTMVFMTTFTNYMMRSNMSVSIVSMVKSGKNNTKIAPCLKDSGKNVTKKKTTSSDTATRYEWNEKEQSYVISAYFWGYMVTTLPGGIISEWVGPKATIFYSSVATGVFTGLTPLSADLGIYGVIACRFIIGLLGGLGYPAINVLIARWAPPNEKGKFLAAMMGNTLGTVVAWPTVGLTTAALSWPWGFYVLVIIQAVFCLVFFILVSDSPQQHRWITEEEQQYIATSQEGKVTTTKAIPPYLKIFLSIPFLSLCCCQFSNLWGLNLILTYAPKFMAQTLGFNIKASSGLASLPYLARLCCSMLFGVVGDWMRTKNFMSVSKLRKFFIIFSHFLPTVCLCLVGTAGCMWQVVVALLVLSQAFNGAVVVGHLVNCQDLSPNFAGTLYGTMNFIAGTTGFIVPTITGVLVGAFDDPLKGPAIIYLIGGIVFATGGVIFILFGSGEVQSWNEKKGDKQEET